MNSLFYDKSISYHGNLIIPFIFNKINIEFIYSYKLLSEYGYKSHLHQANNPSKLYSSSLESILEIAKHHLDESGIYCSGIDYFQERYTYQKNLIILHQERRKFFYDHYPPNELRNIAAPKLFLSAYECLAWVKQGLDHSRIN